MLVTWSLWCVCKILDLVRKNIILLLSVFKLTVQFKWAVCRNTENHVNWSQIFQIFLSVFGGGLWWCSIWQPFQKCSFSLKKPCKCLWQRIPKWNKLHIITNTISSKHILLKCKYNFHENTEANKPKAHVFMHCSLSAMFVFAGVGVGVGWGGVESAASACVRQVHVAPAVKARLDCKQEN